MECIARNDCGCSTTRARPKFFRTHTQAFRITQKLLIAVITLDNVVKRHSLHFCPRNYLRGVTAEFWLSEGKVNRVMAYPKGFR